MYQARGPRFGCPGCVEILPEEERELIRVGHGHDLHVAALIIGLHAVVLEPIAQGDVLRIAELRRGDTLAMEIFGLIDAGIVANDEGSAAAGRSSDYAKSFAIGADIAVDCGIRPNVSHVDGTREERFNCGGAGIETGPLHPHLRTHGLVEPAVSL